MLQAFNIHKEAIKVSNHLQSSRTYSVILIGEKSFQIRSIRSGVSNSNTYASQNRVRISKEKWRLYTTQNYSFNKKLRNVNDTSGRVFVNPALNPWRVQKLIIDEQCTRHTGGPRYPRVCYSHFWVSAYHQLDTKFVTRGFFPRLSKWFDNF